MNSKCLAINILSLVVFNQDIKLGSYIDNINVDPVTGSLWLAGIPRIMDVVGHSNNLSFPSPSQILTMHLGKPSTSGVAFPDYEIREVYKNDGKELSVSYLWKTHRVHCFFFFITFLVFIYAMNCFMSHSLFIPHLTSFVVTLK